MAYIDLTREQKCLVDDDMAEELGKHKWCLSNGYAVRRRLTETGVGHEYIHKRVMGVTGQEDEPVVIIHLNGDRLDCRRENLLKTTRKYRQQRTAPRTKSGFKGVSMQRGKWTAHIGVAGKTVHIGRFTEVNDAARAYDQHAYWYYGDDARLNFDDADSVERYRSTPRVEVERE